ncbi:ABC transporter substrate-binding protein [Erysipelothrix inopinata]|uniref:ABC transporter substrate-binding protein n=1 Tax=Erysipelothrix inopinata TaxID=225084 RepID=A0A7G9S0Z0_9FIRM|nr:ABC transporter substrate-binding protein [Erysipelothrix inopinata]QNN61515.1 ABC transporter substrate-binding protein [Erysipelothrix inopinata]
MKKFMLASLALLLVLTGCGKSGGKEELRVFNWGEYIDKSLIKEFEKENNVKVIYEMFESNEAMYNKLQDGSKYDIIVPSDYMTQRMREEGLLQEVDYSKIPNYSHVIPSLKNRNMDPENKYTVPYFWGNVGILYNKNNVDVKDLEEQGWSIFQNEKYKGHMYFYNSERDAFMIALKALGYSTNTKDQAQIEEASAWLQDMKRNIKPDYVTDEVIDGMESGTRDLAVMYSGDANYVLTKNEDMAYFVPKEGTNTWVDAMVIPANAPNVEMAHKWMNFMISHDASKAITEEIGYTSPIQEVIDEVTAPGGSFEGIESYVTRTGYEKDEEFFYDAKMKEILSNEWSRILAIK